MIVAEDWQSARMVNLVWHSLAELNDESPDHDHDSTVSNLADICKASEDLRCFRKEYVPIAEIDTCQLHDDPEDVEGILKIEGIRSAMRSSAPLPAIVIVHHCPFPSRLPQRPYHVLEGLHRYNAAHWERAPRLYAWVAHVSCCGGPAADLTET